MGQFNPFENSGSGNINTSAYATDISMSIDSKTYIMYTHLKNEDGDVVGKEQKIDLPLETMVVGGSYDDTTKKVILTLKNGNAVEFSVADLVEGLQSEITSTNKLNSDLIDDTNQNNKFVTSAEKTKIENALTEEVYNAGKTVPEGTTFVLNSKTYTVGVNAEVFNDYTSNRVAGNFSHAEGYMTKAVGNFSHAEGEDTTASWDFSHAEGISTTASNTASHSEGITTTASGSSSHAEGENTIASGRSSHTEGSYAKAIGNYSHAEGVSTTTNGISSHAEGANTTAKGNYSHAEGSNATASGQMSHAEGAGSTASGQMSHAEGAGSTASGQMSHAEGEGTIASSNHQHVQGKYNVNDSNSKYAFIIGNGTADSNRSNAFAIDWNGMIYVNNASTGVNVSQLQPIINASNKINADYIDDSNSINKLGLPTIDIDFSKSNIDTIPKDKRYLIQENKPFAFRDTEGGILSEYRFPLSIVAQITETGGLWGCELQIKSHYYATIYINLATFTYSVQYWNLGTLNIDDSGSPNKFVTVDEKTKIANALTEEVYNAGKQVTTNDKTGEIFNSYSNNKATGNNSHAEGCGTTASGQASHAEGTNTIASGFYAHAEGWGTTASGNTSHAEGSITKATANYSHAEGYYTIARSMYQHVQGKHNVEDANDKYAFIIGNGTNNENRSNAFAVDWEGKIYVNNSETGVNVSEINNKLNNHDSALVKLVDGGTKNFLKNEGTTTSTATVNSDGTIIINGTNTSAVNITLSSTTKLPAGDYVLSTENIASNVYLTVRVANDIQYTCTGSTNIVFFHLDEETIIERIYLFINANTSINNLKLTPMICSKAAWDISQNYVPYRPSYDELVARITALENA